MNHIHNIYIVRTTRVLESDGKTILEFFDNTPGPLRFHLLHKPIDIALNEYDEIEWESTFLALRELRAKRRLDSTAILCLLTSMPNENNYFVVSETSFESAGLEPLSNPSPRTFFVHVDSFLYATNAARTTVSIHWIIKKVLDIFLEEHFQQSFLLKHEKARGCLFDFCMNKEDLRFKILSAQICGDCLEVCEQLPSCEPLIEQVIDTLENCRFIELPTRKYLKNHTPRFSGWPFPVAVTRHLFERSQNPMIQLFRLLDHFENLVRFTVITEALWNKIDISIPSKPSLGHWVGLLRELGNNQELQHIQNAYSIAEKDKLVHFRNNYKGHSFVLHDEDQYKGLLNEFQRSTIEVEKSLQHFLYNRQLVIITDIQVQMENRQYLLQGESLEGSNSIFPSFHHATSVDLFSLGIEMNQICLTDRTYSRFVSMHPFLIRTTCPHCGLNHILMKDGEHYLDLQQGHRTKLKI